MKKRRTIVIGITVILMCLLTSCVAVPTKQPIGVWESESPYIKVDFSDNPAYLENMSCSIMLEGEEYTFESVNKQLPDSPHNLYLGKFVLSEEFAEYEQYDFDDEIVIKYHFSGDKLIAEVTYSEYKDEYPVGTKIELISQQDEKNYTIYP